jgi:diaminopimelate decarboxylase
MSLGLGKIRNNLKDDPNRFKTPCYIYDVDAVLENYADLRERLGTPLLLSLKGSKSHLLASFDVWLEAAAATCF